MASTLLSLRFAIVLWIVVWPFFLRSQSSESVGKQLLSVRKQVHSAAPTNAFFTTPWTLDSGPAQAPQTPPAGGNCEPLNEASLSALIADATQREHVNPKLVRALIHRESGGKPCAISSKGAQGLMQLMPATQADFGVRDPFDATENLTAGVKYLKQLLDRYSGNTALALAAYNAGPQRVSPGGKIPDIAETQSYVMGILSSLNEEEESPVSSRVK